MRVAGISTGDCSGGKSGDDGILDHELLGSRVVEPSSPGIFEASRTEIMLSGEADNKENSAVGGG